MREYEPKMKVRDALEAFAKCKVIAKLYLKTTDGVELPFGNMWMGNVDGEPDGEDIISSGSELVGMELKDYFTIQSWPSSYFPDGTGEDHVAIGDMRWSFAGVYEDAPIWIQYAPTGQLLPVERIEVEGDNQVTFYVDFGKANPKDNKSYAPGMRVKDALKAFSEVREVGRTAKLYLRTLEGDLCRMGEMYMGDTDGDPIAVGAVEKQYQKSEYFVIPTWRSPSPMDKGHYADESVLVEDIQYSFAGVLDDSPIWISFEPTDEWLPLERIGVALDAVTFYVDFGKVRKVG